MSDLAFRITWGVCLALGAMATGIGIELYAEGAAPWVAYPVVVAGILFVPLASSTLSRLGATSPR